MEHPVDSITWVDVDSLSANDYNPNHVMASEMELLAFSILKQGWIQPILVTAEGVIIDGFHRATLAKAHKQVRALTGGKVPVCVLDISEPERMLLTIRINRAKGSHAAFKMSDIVSKLVEDYGYDIETIGKGIGATKAEVDLLLQGDVFTHHDIKNHRYSQAWVPAPAKGGVSSKRKKA